MFKYLLVLFFLIVFSQNALTQRLKIESGVSFSSTKKTMYEERANHFQLSIGLDYFDKGFCFLSSNVGYFRKGGKVTLGLVEEYFSSSGVETLYIDCITVNTTFNLKAQLRKSIFYCGIGPRFDINMKDGVDFNNASIHELVEPNIPHIALQDFITIFFLFSWVYIVITFRHLRRHLKIVVPIKCLGIIGLLISEHL